MTHDQLKKMQEESFRRHIDESFEFFDGYLKPKTKRTVREKIILPDLMAAQITLPCTPAKKEEIKVTKKTKIMQESVFDKPYTPKPVQKKQFMSPKVIPDPPPVKKFERHKGVYTNSPSPYGIYDELKEGWLK